MLALLLLAACTLDQATGPTHEGTAVGNPGEVALEATGVPADITLRVAEADVLEVVLEDCDGGGPTIDGGIVDLLDPEPIVVPTGTWCGLEVTLRPEAGIYLEGSTATADFEMTLDPGTLRFEDAIDTSVGLVVGLPLTGLDAEAIDAHPVGTPIGPDDPAAAASTQALAAGANTRSDLAPNAAGESGCQHGSGALWWGFALLLFVRRTHRGYENGVYSNRVRVNTR